MSGCTPITAQPEGMVTHVTVVPLPSQKYSTLTLTFSVSIFSILIFCMCTIVKPANESISPAPSENKGSRWN